MTYTFFKTTSCIIGGLVDRWMADKGHISRAWGHTPEGSNVTSEGVITGTPLVMVPSTILTDTGWVVTW